jgi:chromosome segregation ATPase
MGNILDKEKQFSGKVVKKLEDTLEEVMIQITDKELSISNLAKSLDEALVASNNKSMVLEEKSAEVDDLTEQLKLFRVKNEEQRQDIQTMIASNKEQIHRITLASNKEIADLNKSLKLAMDRNKELEAKVHIATNSIKDSIQQMVVLEDDNKSKKKIIDEMSVDMISLIDRLDKQDDINFQNIGQIAKLDDELMIKNATVEEKNSIINDMSLDIINLTKQLELVMAKNQELETDNQSLVDSNNDIERLKLYMSKSEAQRREIQSLVADRKEQIDQITNASKKEITDLNERLVHVMNRNQKLEKVVQTLTNSVKGSTQQMIETEDDNESKEGSANVLSTIRDWSAARGALAAEHDDDCNDTVSSFNSPGSFTSEQHDLIKRLDVLKKSAHTSSSFEDCNDLASFVDSRGSYTSEQTSFSQDEDRSDDDQATGNDTASFDNSQDSFSSDIFKSEQTSQSQDGSDDGTYVSDNRQDKTIRQNVRGCTDAQSRTAN